MTKSFFPQYSPLTNRLTTRVLNALSRRGINSEEQVIKAYPHDLLKTPGFGLVSLREVEAVLFPGQCYTPPLKTRGRPSKTSALSRL
ncbi:DNA-directed RNA polymerase subunit alpha C-terminal domain-containing protein [Comamonas odontotermitis]|uniref:DNA-directed RNA polymerase subunit alpha C-terminal domain-containing protein n=1 Tax=Comamonas odontotermitis TaxID=379895 RepID=UPI001612CDDA